MPANNVPNAYRLEKVCFSLHTWIDYNFFIEFFRLCFALLSSRSHTFGIANYWLILAPFFWPVFSLWRLLRHTVYFLIWSFMMLHLNMEVFLHLFISTLGGIFPIRKMCVFLFCSGHFSSIVLIMSFPVFFLVHLLV